MADHYEAQSEELARMQELSNTWTPEATGPLVSQRFASSELVKEYASADPIYQSLSHKYAQYRTVRGDGLCGWRAIAFSYFEVLLRIGDKQKCIQEQQRLTAFDSLIIQTCCPKHVYEDFLEDTLDLLKELSVASDVEATLLQVFNDEVRSQSIITYFKLLTSAWIRTHASDFEGYLSVSVDEFCKLYIDPSMAQLEHVSLTALVEALVKPAGIGVEILYLDLSDVEEVKPSVYEPSYHSDSNPGWFRLLYRPGHYDILYKAEDLPSTAIRTTVQPAQSDLIVGYSRGQSVSLDHPAPLGFAPNNFEIPGMGYFPTQHMSSKTWDLDAALNYRSIQPQPHPHPPPDPMPSDHVKVLPLRSPDYTTEPIGIASPPGYFSETNASPHVLTPSVPISPTGSAPVVIDASKFRPSKFEYERDLNAPSASTPVFQTSAFKHSHFNQAHFNNPEFTPEQWNPEKEYHETRRKRPSQ